MKIDFNPHAAAQAQHARGPQVQTTPPAPEGSDDGVTVTLSQAAKQILKGDADYVGNSPAHQARAALLNEQVAFAEGQDASTTPFGQIVKTFAQAKHAPETEDAPPVDGGDVGEITEPSDGGDTTATDGADSSGDTGTTVGGGTTVAAAPAEGGGTGTGIGEADPAVVVAEPDITEVLDESAPSEGETSDTGSGEAGSGDAVASTGDIGDITGTTETGEPVAVVDTGEVTDELLDLLDENSEEVV